MRILLLEKEQIVRKDIELQLLKHGLDVTCDCSQGFFDYIIIGQLFYLDELKKNSSVSHSGTQFIFFITVPEKSAFSSLGAVPEPVVILKPGHTEILLSYLKPVICI
ncbi:MAG: hypothetical protein JWO09_1193 [Bacteroidetes bacterium]|nr:hypothetical protein [Bacteroidota bacterium]